MEEGEGDTGARVKNRVPESRQPTMASRVGTDSTGEESWVRSSKGQKASAPLLLNPRTPVYYQQGPSSACGILVGATP